MACDYLYNWDGEIEIDPRAQGACPPPCLKTSSSSDRQHPRGVCAGPMCCIVEFSRVALSVHSPSSSFRSKPREDTSEDVSWICRYMAECSLWPSTYGCSGILEEQSQVNHHKLVLGWYLDHRPSYKGLKLNKIKNFEVFCRSRDRGWDQFWSILELPTPPLKN